MHLQKLIPTRFHRLPSRNTRGGSCTYWNPQSFATWMGTRVEVAVKGTCGLKRLEKIGRSDKRRPLCTLLAPCGTDRYLVPLIGRINGAGCGAKGEAGPKCSAGGQREMDGTREKKRRFHLKKGSWIAKGEGRDEEWRGPRKLRPFRLTMPLRLISRTVSLWLDVSTLIYWVFW